MSKRKGLSLEEKRQRIHDIFIERKDVFQLKEVEKIASKEKGINSMVVKEIVQSLVDDNMVECEKVGTSNYYWSFPSKVAITKKKKLHDITNAVQDSRAKLEKVKRELKAYELSKEDPEVKARALEKMKLLEASRAKQAEEVAKYKDCDPEELKKRKEEIEVAKEAVNRWTDNVFSLKKFCRDKINVEASDFHKNFDIPEEFDYLE